MTRWDEMTDEERSHQASIRKRGDYWPHEVLDLLGINPGSEKPGLIVGSKDIREQWSEYCIEHDIPIGGGSIDRREMYAGLWGIES